MNCSFISCNKVICFVVETTVWIVHIIILPAGDVAYPSTKSSCEVSCFWLNAVGLIWVFLCQEMKRLLSRRKRPQALILIDVIMTVSDTAALAYIIKSYSRFCYSYRRCIILIINCGILHKLLTFTLLHSCIKKPVSLMHILVQPLGFNIL